MRGGGYMRIINGIQDYQKFIEEIDSLGVWESWWHNLYIKYKSIYNYQLENLYMADISLFKNIVMELDIDRAREELLRIQTLDLERIIAIINQSCDMLSFDDDFDVYLLIGFNHIDGTAGICENKPFIYYGLESIKEEQLDYLIPHELNHLVRMQNLDIYLKSQSIMEIPFGETLISEGLAIIYPIILCDDLNQLDEELMNSFLTQGVSKEDFLILRERQKEYLAEVFSYININMTKELLHKYISFNSDTGVPAIGYYVGAIIILRLIRKGYDIKFLTRCPAAEVIRLYRLETN